MPAYVTRITADLDCLAGEPDQRWTIEVRRETEAPRVHDGQVRRIHAIKDLSAQGIHAIKDLSGQLTNITPKK